MFDALTFSNQMQIKLGAGDAYDQYIDCVLNSGVAVSLVEDGGPGRTPRRVDIELNCRTNILPGARP